MLTPILSILPPYQGRKHIIKHSQSVGDIITGILATHKQYSADYDKIAGKFWRGNSRNTAKCIFDFLKKNTHYVIEPDDKQTLRSPSAILYLGSQPGTGLDCKSYSLFIGGVLDALRRAGKNTNWCYRFASYRVFDKLPHHVFVVINPGSLNEIWIDPVLSTFNNRKQYSYKIDKYPMALIAMAGIGRTKRAKAERKQRLKNALRKRGKLLLKFNPATASARNSFLLLVKVNAFNLGRRLYKMVKSNPDKLKKFWEKIGGNWNSLQKNILIGSKHKGEKIESINGIGVVPAIAAAIAAATPIVLKITQLLKSVGVDVKDLENAGKKVISRIIDKKIDDTAEAGDEATESITNETPESGPVEADGEPGENGSEPETIEGIIRRKQYMGRRTYKPKMGNFI